MAPSSNAGIYIDAVDGPPLTDDIADLTGVPTLDATQRICGVHYTDADFVPVDNNLVSVLAHEVGSLTRRGGNLEFSDICQSAIVDDVHGQLPGELR